MSDERASDPKEQQALIDALREAHMPTQQAVWDRNLTHEEFYHMLSRYPYLELCNQDAPTPSQDTPKLHKAKSGWLVHDYGNVISSASMNLPIQEIRRLYKTLLGETPTSEQEAEDDDRGEGGRGTLQGQIVQTAYEMVQIAYNNWSNVTIVDGFYGMKRAAWVAAVRFGKKLAGFRPTSEDKVVLYWANKLTPNVGTEFKPTSPTGR